TSALGRHRRVALESALCVIQCHSFGFQHGDGSQATGYRWIILVQSRLRGMAAGLECFEVCRCSVFPWFPLIALAAGGCRLPSARCPVTLRARGHCFCQALPRSLCCGGPDITPGNSHGGDVEPQRSEDLPDERAQDTPENW